jgi:hypothetical protein
MMRFLVLSTLVLSLAAWQSSAAVAGELKHPHMHVALRELREARTELKEAAHDFGGHRVKALEATDAAVKQIDRALKASGDYVAGAGKVEPGAYKGYASHPHIHHALHELRLVRAELKEAKHDFGGHREAALRDTNHAIEQLELCLKFARK